MDASRCRSARHVLFGRGVDWDRTVVEHGPGDRIAEGSRVSGLGEVAAVDSMHVCTVGRDPSSESGAGRSRWRTVFRARLAERGTTVRRGLRPSAASPRERAKGELGPQPTSPRRLIVRGSRRPGRYSTGEDQHDCCNAIRYNSPGIRGDSTSCLCGAGRAVFLSLSVSL